MIAVGSIGARRLARVDPLGGVAPDDAAWRLEWWIGADDRWRLPEHETTVRQRQIGDAPVVETAMRVPGGDARHRVYGAGGAGDVIVVEVENSSPAPFVAALVVRGARSLAVEAGVVRVDGRPSVVSARAPARWSAGSSRAIEIEVTSGAAASGAFPARRDRAGRLDGAFLHPVSHRTTLRVALPLGRPAPVDVSGLPSADDVARGWKAHLERGMRVELPDEGLAGAVRSARAQLLLESSDHRPSPDLAAALEDWGFDNEAAAAWSRLSGRMRRAAARRAAEPPGWAEVDAARRDPAPFLLSVRAALLHESPRDDGTLTLLAELPAAWRGQPVEVHDAPTRLGLVSYALRWHGDRPALLWDAPAGARLIAPALDADWTSNEPTGEALLTGSVG